ncbi:DNA polymerase III subunit gamma/tau [Pseudoalteromonas rubra]|uniref:DNA-directed DNA polymerase n=1 Tax=Pseudoalteromonas rubra TaxID=43658 RepID=A0A0F4QHG2_9GAMM|nr:DNA polymerase III subunit gamma/tau [Pseudoalteromonas rubra]KJZ06725.1 ATPase AAA [Pseudoalteromonas rubra]
MSYQVLARKWRPQSFHEMMGQEHVKQALINALNEQRLHHAYLFTGTRGVGKTTIARIFAKSLNCEVGITSTPCGQCSACEEIEAGKFIDLIEIDAASRTKVEDTREILDNVQYAPTRGRYKVYLIDEVHMLSKHSFNALLKTLEEPPEHVKFLLATTDPQKLPITILSRCLQFNLNAMAQSQIVTQLAQILPQESVNFEQTALEVLAKAADGSMRDALSLTDQAIAQTNGELNLPAVQQMLGLMDSSHAVLLMAAVLSQDGETLLAEVADIALKNGNFASVLDDLISLLHLVQLTQLVPQAANFGQFEAEQVKTLAQQLTPQDTQFMYQLLLAGKKDLSWAPEPRLGFEMIMLRLLAFERADFSQAAGPTPAGPAKDQGKVGKLRDMLSAKQRGPQAQLSTPAPERQDPVAQHQAKTSEPQPVPQQSAEVAAQQSPAPAQQPNAQAAPQQAYAPEQPGQQPNAQAAPQQAYTPEQPGQQPNAQAAPQQAYTPEQPAQQPNAQAAPQQAYTPEQPVQQTAPQQPIPSAEQMNAEPAHTALPQQSPEDVSIEQQYQDIMAQAESQGYEQHQSGSAHQPVPTVQQNSAPQQETQAPEHTPVQQLAQKQQQAQSAIARILQNRQISGAGRLLGGEGEAKKSEPQQGAGTVPGAVASGRRLPHTPLADDSQQSAQHLAQPQEQIPEQPQQVFQPAAVQRKAKKPEMAERFKKDESKLAPELLEQLAPQAPGEQETQETTLDIPAPENFVSPISDIKFAHQKDDWAQMIEQMQLGGRVRQFALHAMFNQQGQHCTLQVEQSQQHLDSSMLREKLHESLAEQLNEPVELNIEFVDVVNNTPFLIQQDIDQQRYLQAVDAVNNDPVIQAFAREFEASVDEKSVRAL